jgi:hypothetical protein
MFSTGTIPQLGLPALRLVIRSKMVLITYQLSIFSLGHSISFLRISSGIATFPCTG